MNVNVHSLRCKKKIICSHSIIQTLERYALRVLEEKLAGITLQAGNLFWSGTYALDFIWALYKNIRQGEVLFSNTFSKAS